VSESYSLHDAGTAAATREGYSFFIPSSDGLRLHVREYSSPSLSAVAVVCLPGLTRTTDDFRVLAPALAYGTTPRRVIAIDSRGRGKSEYDSDPRHYNPAVELNDVITILAARKIGSAIFVGSSRGGILTMLLADANSDILSVATVREMQARHPGLEIMEIPDQGHVPLLDEPDLINRIAAFVQRF
jgi:pimeloyl-ACP methyl ester carboxylesterase